MAAYCTGNMLVNLFFMRDVMISYRIQTCSSLHGLPMIEVFYSLILVGLDNYFGGCYSTLLALTFFTFFVWFSLGVYCGWICFYFFAIMSKRILIYNTWPTNLYEQDENLIKYIVGLNIKGLNFKSLSCLKRFILLEKVNQNYCFSYSNELIDIIINMKASQSKKPIFIQIGRNLTTTKPNSRRQSLSFASSNLPLNSNPYPARHAIQQVNQTQPLLPNRRKVSQTNSSINKTYALVSNINDDIIFTRKQNYLNSKFNIRKNKLREITKENKQLYERINSQKSFYSSTDLNKSFQSNAQIKKRLSQSKLSQRLNSSRSSSRSKIDSSKGNRFEKKKQIKIAIKATNIKNTQSNDLQSFKGLFTNDISLTKNQPKVERDSISFKSYRTNQVYTRTFKLPARKSIDPIQDHLGAPNEGGLLHRIAEQMIDPKRQANKPRKPSNLKNTKKQFNF